ncbi:MAG: outer membrane protein assembly factor BamA, partial [Gammaproteobacteria bacterium]|nr:outer membrane protein assembly factor BamA [Gammaproteobacteria bacterium]
LGYSQSSGLLFNASVSQDNFLGSGKRVSFAFNNSDVNTVYSFSYTNPYYTIDGISRGFGSYYRETDADEANLSDYTTDSYGANVSFGIPITEYERIYLNTEYENIELKPTLASPSEVFDFIDQHGDNYDNIKLTGSWSHDTRNKALFADRGGLMRIALETAIPGSGLEYYKLNYRQQQFVPLTRNLILSLNGELGYGEGFGDHEQLPFFENFFAGGVRSVRGFEDNTLGPLDSNGNPIGGSFRVVGNAELIFPVPFFEDAKSFRLSAFFDIGNVFEDFEDFDADELRYSVGLAGLWLSPMGPLSVSLGYPINDESDDEVQNFQFTIGTFF